jgi:ATP adenylyltransferase
VPVYTLANNDCKKSEVNMIWQTANNIATQALENNSLQPIASQLVTTYAHGVQFTYHLRNEFAEKKPHQTTQTNNPFLPHEPAMFVAQCGLQHKVLLNKYPVIQPHLLVCANQFVAQNTVLNLSDFNAWLRIINDKSAQHPTLGFYNSEPTAGASQPHRHMQVVQLTLALIDERPYLSHFLAGADFVAYHNSDPQTLYTVYLKGLSALNLMKNEQQTHPHNLLVTHNLLWILPRSQVQTDGIYANGLNFAGHFLLKNKTQLTWLLEHDPFDILKKLIKIN